MYIFINGSISFSVVTVSSFSTRHAMLQPKTVHKQEELGLVPGVPK